MAIGDKLYVADKATLDQANAKIYDWKNTNPQFAYGATVNTTFTTMLDVTGSGFLIGINVAGDGGQARITIDSVELTTLSIGGGRNDHYSFMHRFNSSLKVELERTTGSVTQAVYIAYVLD